MLSDLRSYVVYERELVRNQIDFSYISFTYKKDRFISIKNQKVGELVFYYEFKFNEKSIFGVSSTFVEFRKKC